MSVGYLEYAYGVVKRTPNEIIDLHEKLVNFQNDKSRQSVFVLFLKAVNHWVTLVAFKPDPT